MSTNKIDARQSIYRGTLDQIGNQTNPQLDHLVVALNNQVTPLLRMSAAASPSLVVSVGGGDLTDAETNRRRAIPHVGTAYVQFTSGTITFPASSGGNITCSPGTTLALTVASGNYAAVLVYLDGNGNLNVLPGTDDAVLNTAITNLPPSPDDTLPLGFVVVHNVAGTIQNITQSQIAQFGTGAGGGGSGNVTSVEAALRDYNNFAGTKYLDPNIFKVQKATKVDGSSTGSFDLVKNAFKFTSIGQTFVSTNLANAEFLAEGVDITDLHLYLHWLTGFIDTAATYEASRDGGTNWSAVTMTRVGTASNAYRGYLQFSAESVQQSLDTVAATGAGSALNATTNQQLSSKLILSSTSVVTSIDFNLNYGGVGTGTVTARIVRDSAGAPSTAVGDILSESNAKTISTASLGGTGNITVNFDMPDVVLTAGTYHIVLLTDSAYKAGTLDLSWRSGTGTNGATYNGTTWTTGAASKAHTTKGRVHDLRIRVTAGTATKYIEGMGVYFPSDDGLTQPNGTKYVQRFYFSGDSNTTSFQLNWVPDPDLLDIIDPYRGQSYAIEPGVAQIAGQTITFAPNTFNFPGESIVLIFRQVKGIAIDNSDTNAAAISTHTQNLLDVGDETSDLEFVTIPKIAVPNTTITNRAQIPDMSQDLGSRMAIARVPTEDLILVEDESGPNGELVYRTNNDRYDRIRFYGTWAVSVTNDGPRPRSATINDVVEITFYGTGLNVLNATNQAGQDVRASIDGGSEGANIFGGTTFSSVLDSRSYRTNQSTTVVSGLTLGTHTVKLRQNNSSAAFNVFGFDVLHESSTIAVNPGSQFVRGSKRILASQQLLAYNSSFETGTLGTRGGRVIVYQKLDGTIAKAVQPTDSSQLNLTSASHSNEEVVRSIWPREFGAGRADDWSLVSANGTYLFTLDDGTTSLFGNLASVGTVNGFEAATASGAGGSFLSLTFVGTGLDIIQRDSASGTLDTYSVTIDGTNVGNLSTVASTTPRQVKIVSGLPYGTHTVKINRTAAVNQNLGVVRFIIYQPKTPTLPTYAKLLSTYNVMATFVANTTTGQDTIATGVLRKYITRELTYVNGTGGTTDWTISAVTGTRFGFVNNASDRLNANYQYVFFGTGLELRFDVASTRATNAQVSLQSLSTGGSLINLTSTNFPTATFSVYGTGVVFTASTGILDQADASAQEGAGLRVSGLPLGLYLIKVNNGTATQFLTINGFDIITPIHSYKSDLYENLQNTLSIGSQGMEDSRKIKSLEQVTDQKAWGQAVGVSSNPTTTSTTQVPMPDMSLTLKTSGGALKCEFVGRVSNGGSGNGTTCQFYVDGVAVGILTSQVETTATANITIANTCIVPVAAGVHSIQVYWSVSGGTSTLETTNRILTVEEK